MVNLESTMTETITIDMTVTDTGQVTGDQRPEEMIVAPQEGVTEIEVDTQ